MIRVEPTNQKDSGPCPCCGDLTRIVWGHVFSDEHARAVYYARWTLNQAKHGALWMVSVGDWEDPNGERWSVGLDSRAPDGRIAFMLIDAEETPWGNAPGLGKPLTRDEALGTPLAEEVFQIVDACLEQDARLVAMRETLESPPAAGDPKWKPAGRKRKR